MTELPRSGGAGFAGAGAGTGWPDILVGHAASELTARLTRLESAGLISKAPYQTNPVRYDYALTAKGRGLLPVLQALSEWGSRNFPNVRRPPDRFMNMKSG